MRLLAAAPRRLLVLALAAAVLAIVVPSGPVARRSDGLLALLVLVTALGISAHELAGLRRHATAVTLLSVVPFVVLTVVAWALGRPFGAGIRHGLLAVGVSSAEVASVGVTAIAGADATIALGAVVGSLVVAAVIGPFALGLLGGSAGGHGAGHLLGRFALVVLAPLVVGVAARTRATWLAAYDAEREGVAALAVVALVYAALSGIPSAGNVAAALLAGLAFLVVSGALAEAWRRTAGGATALPGAMTIGMRDFAVAAVLATQAFGTAAATVPGAYGVMMLLAGSAVATRARVAGNVRA